MKCSMTQPTAWLVAAPFFPFLVAAWAGAAAGRKTRWEPAASDCGAGRKSVPEADIVETAVGTGCFETLLAAVQKAGLAKALKGEGPLTVFAPTDDAFARLPEGALEELLADEEKLTSLLRLHVVPARVEASTLGSYAAIKTLGGESLEVDTSSVGIKIGSAYVVEADIATSNGVIHAIDSVLLPS